MYIERSLQLLPYRPDPIEANLHQRSDGIMAEIIQLFALLDRRHIVLDPLLSLLQWHPFVLMHLLIELHDFVICLLG